VDKTTGVAAPAVEATANGSVAAISTAPAARAFTKWRGIRSKVSIKNPSFVVFIFIHSIYKG
jgi:TRAP-type mannitol/chloroaromatic compound transport system permease large subunit